jgi:MoaA/NifB/PqqE/SkfB family radical SAM enzyme
MKKGKIINFEWFCDYNRYDPDEWDIVKTDLIKNDIKKAVADGYNTIVGAYFLDGFLQQAERYDQFIDHLKEIKDYAYSQGVNHLYLLSGHGEELKNSPLEYFHFDYNLRILYNSYKDSIKNLPKYNSDNNKFLFLTGMPDRANRIGLLSKFYDADMLKNAKWSFFPPWAPQDKKWCRDYLSHYTDDEYNTFLKKCDRQFDNRFESAKPYYGNYSPEELDVDWMDVVDTEWVRAPAHINSSVYDNTVLSIVSEGPNYWGSNYDFVTEKVWREFLHKQPFILAGWPDQMRYLKKLGYKTFEEYMLIPDYAYIEDEDERLNAVVKNTEYFLKNHKKYSDQITADVEHNYKKLFEYIQKQDDLLKYFNQELNISQEQIDFYTNQTGYKNLVMRPPHQKKTCAAFWKHTNIRGDNRIFPCCRFKSPIATFDGNLEKVIHIKEYEDLRNADVSKLPQCSKCMYEEENGKKSLRQEFNEQYDTDNVGIEFLEIGFDNICNLTCDGCWSEFSSAWARKENIIHYTSVNEIHNVPNTIKKVLFLGGEPLMTNRHKRFLTLIENPANVEIIYNTNGTFMLDNKLIEKLQEFKRVTFIVSIDAYGDLNNQVRSGSNWKDILDFISQIKSLKFNLEINSVLHLNNWHGIKELEKYVNTLNVTWTINVLTYPKKLDMNNYENKQEIIDLINTTNIPNKEYVINHLS